MKADEKLGRGRRDTEGEEAECSLNAETQANELRPQRRQGAVLINTVYEKHSNVASHSLTDTQNVSDGHECELGFGGESDLVSFS